MKAKVILSTVSLIAIMVIMALSNQFTTANAAPNYDGNYLYFVRDANGNAVQGASVTLTGEKFTETQTSGPTGRVMFFGVPDGTYSIGACYGGSGRRYLNFDLPTGFGTTDLVLQSNITFCPNS